MRRQEEATLYGNLTAMIDVVFQIIIFFVCTTNMQDSAIDTRIRLANAPNGLVAPKDPLEVVIDVNARGEVSIARNRTSVPVLAGILRSTVSRCGSEVPVVVRGDARATHDMVRAAMDTAAGSGIWKIRVAALKEKGR